MTLQAPSYKRKWFTCPHCGRRLVQYEEDGKSEKIYLKCKSCKNEVEIKVK